MEQDNIFYSAKYFDEKYEYRHCELRQDGLSYAIVNYERSRSPTSLPEEFLPLVRTHQSGKLLSENQWRQLGITMSMGWQHYLVYSPNPTVICFRRPLGTNGRTGLAPKDWEPYPGEINVWAIEKFNPGDEVWVKEQIGEPLFTLEDEDGDRVEVKEGMRLNVLQVDKNIQVKRESWSEGKWISSEYAHMLTKYGPGMSREPQHDKKRGKKRKLSHDAKDLRKFGKDLCQKLRKC